MEQGVLLMGTSVCIYRVESQKNAKEVFGAIELNFPAF